jgi:excisionase family DNA binding protein
MIDPKQESGSHPPTVNASTAGITRISKDKEIAGSEVMTLQELATYLCISRATVYRLVQRGGFPAFKVGRQWRVNLRLVQNYLVKNYERKTGHGGST